MTIKKPSKKRNNPKYKLMAKNLAKCAGDQTKAYMETFPHISRTSAGAAASRMLTAHPEIVDQAADILRRNGIDEDTLSKALKRKLTARKTIVVSEKIHEVDDNSAQLKAIELGMKGLKMIKDGDDNRMQVNIQHNQALIVDRLADRIDSIVKMFDGLTPPKAN